MTNHKDPDNFEVEANEWASNFLVSKKDWDEFILRYNFSEPAVLKFANEQGISPGIIVGKLQHRGLIRYSSQMNRLKRKVDLVKIN